jgi:hypothetical protein
MRTMQVLSFTRSCSSHHVFYEKNGLSNSPADDNRKRAMNRVTRAAGVPLRTSEPAPW